MINQGEAAGSTVQRSISLVLLTAYLLLLHLPYQGLKIE